MVNLSSAKKGVQMVSSAARSNPQVSTTTSKVTVGVKTPAIQTIAQGLGRVQSPYVPTYNPQPNLTSRAIFERLGQSMVNYKQDSMAAGLTSSKKTVPSFVPGTNRGTFDFAKPAGCATMCMGNRMVKVCTDGTSVSTGQSCGSLVKPVVPVATKAVVPVKAVAPIKVPSSSGSGGNTQIGPNTYASSSSVARAAVGQSSPRAPSSIKSINTSQGNVLS